MGRKEGEMTKLIPDDKVFPTSRALKTELDKVFPLPADFDTRHDKAVCEAPAGKLVATCWQRLRALTIGSVKSIGEKQRSWRRWMTQTLLKRNCEWVDCLLPAMDRYRGHWLCAEHLEIPDVRADIDEDFEDGEEPTY